MAAFSIFTTVLALLAASASSTVTVASVFPDVTHAINHSALYMNPNIMLDLSFLFGWEMAGAALSQNETVAACAEISSIGHGKWAAIGLDPVGVQTPMCDYSITTPNPKHAILFTIYYTTEIFTTQLGSAFHGNESFSYLCNNVKYSLLDDLKLNDTAVFGAVCSPAAEQIPPRPFGPGHGIDPDAMGAATVTQTASVLYAYILAAAATTSSELNVLCAKASKYADNLDAELMDGSAFKVALCEIKEPISVDVAADVIVALMTKTFITTMENVSNVGGWFGWLCDHVDSDGLNEVGLFGEAVVQTFCQDAKSGRSF